MISVLLCMPYESTESCETVEHIDVIFIHAHPESGISYAMKASHGKRRGVRRNAIIVSSARRHNCQRMIMSTSPSSSMTVAIESMMFDYCTLLLYCNDSSCTARVNHLLQRICQGAWDTLSSRPLKAAPALGTLENLESC